ncbi:MAG: hypothetical protein WCK85_12385 [Chlorobium sp.]
MNPFFSITVKDIQGLDDVQSRELVARLCKAELKKNGISPAAVSWGGDQRAEDGGIDVRVDVSPPFGISGYIKNDRSVFQVKAEKDFRAKKIEREMAPKGILRPAIAALAQNNGAYIIVSTRDTLTDTTLPDRIQAMSACIANYGLDGKIIVDFYDCRKIADWAEEHPGIAHWIRYVLGKPILGWQPYAPWAYIESDTDAQYLIDERVKVFVPNREEGCDVLSAINRLRRELSKNVSVRIVGLSGVGKTRLVQALFDKRIWPEQAALETENVIYTDLSDNPTPQPTAMLDALLADDSDCVVVVDNCGQDIHKKLTKIAKSPGSKLRLITVEYDIRDDWPESTECYRLEGSSDEIIKELLKRHYPVVLSDNDRNKIAEFSDGNARVAFALASTTERKGELARLQDSELFTRLFVQKNTENDELLKCAKVASLLYSFDSENHSLDSEIALLACLAQVTVLTFFQNIAELQKRGLVQQRGQWRAVLPQAIANRLAADAVDSFPIDVLVRTLVDQASERVARSFSRRLGYLHESKTVKEIVQQLFRPNGRLNDLSKLTDIEFQIFTNIAPVDEQSTLDAIDRAIHNPDFISKENCHRYDFARIIRSLAYEPALFDQATAILVRFAVAEPESQNWNSIRDILKSMFFCHLSGTEAKSDQRSKVVRELILSSDKERETLGFSLLESALKASHFSSSFGFGFGARKRGYGWWPSSHEERLEWYVSFIDIAVEAGKNDTSSGRNARAILAQSLRELWVNAGMEKEIIAAANEFRPIDGWPEGWLGTRQILTWDKEKICEEPLQELLRLEQELAPRDLKAEIRAKVLTRESVRYAFDEESDDHDGQYRRVEQVAEKLGKKASLDEKLLFDLLPDLMRYPTFENVWHFGFGVGQETQTPESLLAQVRDIIERDEQGSVILLFFKGFIAGWQKVKPDEVSDFLDIALFDEVWVNRFPELQSQVTLDDVGYKRLLKSLELDKTRASQYQCLRYRLANDTLSVNMILTLVGIIAAKQDDGLFVAIELMSQVIHRAQKEESDDYQQDLAKACVLFLRTFDWKKIQRDYRHIDYATESVLGFALTASSSEHEMLEILHNLIAHAKSECFSFDQGKFLAPFFKVYPKRTLDAVYVADDDGEYITAHRLVSLSMGDEHESVVRVVPDDVLIKWCEISPEERYIFAAYTCQLFKKKTSDQDNANTSIALSDVAQSIFAGAKDKKAVLDIFCNRFRPTISNGSRSTILTARLKLLRTLNPEGDLTLMPEIAEAEEALKKEIAEIAAREEAEERSRTGSFE